MTFQDWINNIRWKYFTNNKSGLIFKELMKEFEMVDKMTENKRFIQKDEAIIDTMTDELVTASSKDGAEILVDKLNSQEKRIKELEKEEYRLNLKVKRLIDELANCYEKLGW